MFTVWLDNNAFFLIQDLTLISLILRFIGSAKISLRDLANGQATSLPLKNIPLVNEKQQAIGVINHFKK